MKTQIFHLKSLTGLALTFISLIGLATELSGQPLTLNADGTPHTIQASTEDKLDEGTPQDYIIPNTTFTGIHFTLKGGDGGFAKHGSKQSYGGAGATTTAAFKIGFGPYDLKPGGIIRFIVGKHGYDWDGPGSIPATGCGGGGKIEVQSEVGNGTTFKVLLPVTTAAAVHKESDGDAVVAVETTDGSEEKDGFAPLIAVGIDQEESFARHSHPDTSLLIIEDNPDLIIYLESLLEDHFQLLIARDGQEGIDMALEHIPDLILSDVMMPEKDGFEVCSTLKQDIRTSHIPIVLLTAKATVESRIEGIERGADAYLAKPFDERELFVRLKKLVELRRQLQHRYQSLQKDLRQEPPAEEQSFALEDAFMTKLQQIVADNLDNTDFGPTQLCTAMSMSRSHLHLKIKALTNLSTSIFIRTIRLHKAKDLLQAGELNVTQVAFEVGFNDLSYFSRKFTEEFGVNPQKFAQS